MVETPGAYFVMPTGTHGQTGPVGIWVSAAGWAAATARLLGAAWVLSPDGVFTPAEAGARSAAPGPTRGSPAPRRLVPDTAVTLVKDASRAVKARRFHRRLDTLELPAIDPAFVWQRHDLFHRGGLRLAQRLGVPSVLFVDAPLVWEARRWGVGRPGWGSIVERLGERPQFRSTDVLACVSEEVAEEVVRLGAPEPRVMVTPCGVDLGTFTPEQDGGPVRDRHGLGDAFVVGWTGSFRRFHGVDQALEAMAIVRRQAPDATLLLVGDGLDRPRIEALARSTGVPTVFTGTVSHTEVPAHLAAMDVTLVLADDREGFHYSPIKLREYMASGRPIVASDVGQMGRLLRGGDDALLTPPNDPQALAERILVLHRDVELRRRLGRTAREHAVAHSSWDAQVARVLERIERLAPSSTR